MQKKSTNSPKYLLILLLGLGVYLAGFYTAKVDVFKVGNVNSPGYELQGDLLKSRKGVNVNLLWEVWNKLETEYIDPDYIDGQQLLYGAASGLVNGLDDRYTSFLTPEEKKEYLSGNKREFEGIGTTLAEKDDFVIIESPIDGYPAQKAGLKPNDVILKVDDEDMQGKSATEVAKKIRGEANTIVKITYYRPSDTETNEVEITRKKIDLENIEFEELESGIYKIKIYQFTDEDVASYNQKWDRIMTELAAKNPEGLVIDLRNNPGGFVDSVRHSLGEFITKDTVIFQEENRRGERTVYKVNRVGKFTNIPLVVIVNQGSASSSEIFAGAIQDNKRGVIIGTETVGKGVEQKLIDLSDGSMLQIVFQKWLTANGRNITTKEPITPDVSISDTDAQSLKAIEILKNR